MLVKQRDSLRLCFKDDMYVPSLDLQAPFILQLPHYSNSLPESASTAS